MEIFMIQQLSVFVENQQGKLADVVTALAAANVDIRALSIADTQDFGILRLIVSDIALAQQTLARAGYIVSVTPVVGVAVPDRPGGLASVIRLLSDNGFNLEYMYAFLASSRKNAYVVLRVENAEEVMDFLRQRDVPLLTEEDILRL